MLMDVEHDRTRARPRSASRRRRAGRWLVAALGLAVVAAGGLFGYQQYFAAPPLELRTQPVVEGDVEKTVTALGSLKPRDYVDVGAQVSGQLNKVHVEIGDRVAAGDLLAEIDPAVITARVRVDRANLENLKAQLAQQQAELALARQQLARNQRLFKLEAVSQDLLESSETAVAVAAARIDALKAQIAAAESTLEGNLTNLGYTRIYAPMAGTVVSQTALEGQTLNANQTAPTILQIADLDTMTLWAQVAEADIVRIEVGMPVYFTTLGLPERRWQAAVRQLLPTPEVVNDVVLYNVLIDVENTERLLLPEMTAQVFFLLSEAKDVPVVPLAALEPHGGGDGELYRVRVMTDAGPVERTVRIGLISRTSAEVIEGLAVGERVVTGTREPAGATSRRRFGPRL